MIFEVVINSVVAAGTLALAAAAFFQIRESRKQAVEWRRAAIRPIVVPRSKLPANDSDMWGGSNNCHSIKLQNVGSGVATNIWGVILPRVNFSPVPGRLPPQFYWRSLFPIAKEETAEVAFLQGGTTFSGRDRLEGHALGAPEQGPTGAPTPPGYLYIARLTLTYSDISGLRHGAIFDLAATGVWTTVALLSGITAGLGEMDQTKRAGVRTGTSLLLR